MNFRVEWEHTCYICNAPLNVSVIASSYDILKKIVTYSSAEPLNLKSNFSKIKFDTMRNKNRVCYACFINSSNISLDNLTQREIRGTPLKLKHNSVSMRDLHEWFRRVNRCLREPLYNWDEFDKKPYNMKFIRLFVKNDEYYLNN